MSLCGLPWSRWRDHHRAHQSRASKSMHQLVIGRRDFLMGTLAQLTWPGVGEQVNDSTPPGFASSWRKNIASSIRIAKTDNAHHSLTHSWMLQGTALVGWTFYFRATSYSIILITSSIANLTQSNQNNRVVIMRPKTSSSFLNGYQTVSRP